MPEKPHHYIVHRESGGAEFETLVRAVKEEGTRRRYGGWKYWTIAVDGMTYWLTSGGGAGYITNRKPTAEAGWDDDDEQEAKKRAALDDLRRGIAMGLVDDEEQPASSRSSARPGRPSPVEASTHARATRASLAASCRRPGGTMLRAQLVPRGAARGHGGQARPWWHSRNQWNRR